MNRIKFKGTGREEHKGVHFRGTPGGDYTLCGLSLDYDPDTTGDYETTKEKVNCKDCREIVEYCKTLKLKNK